MRILLVDDDDLLLSFLATIVRNEGYETITTDNGQEAYRLILGQQSTLVISDWNMPGLTGSQLCRKIRAENLPHYVYFILLTARNDQKSLLEGMDAGADDFLVKPVDPHELLARIHAGVRILRLEQDLGERNAALDRVNAELSQVYEIIKNDVSMAAMIQKSLLPKPQIWQNCTFQWLYLPSNLLSGDMFGYFPVDETHIAFFQMDVSGHGVSSALISFAISKRLLQEWKSVTIANLSDKKNGNVGFLSPEQVIGDLNRQFSNEPESESYFLTLVCGVIDLDTGEIVLSSAGHPPPLLWKRSSNLFIESTAGGFPVGIIEQTSYEVETLNMESGDRLFVFSDGIFECPNPDGDLFGIDRFRESLLKMTDLPVSQVPQEMSKVLQAWHGGDHYLDDISLLILER